MVCVCGGVCGGESSSGSQGCCGAGRSWGLDQVVVGYCGAAAAHGRTALVASVHAKQDSTSWDGAGCGLYALRSAHSLPCCPWLALRQEITPEKAIEILRRISDEDCRILGFDPKYSRPDWMILQAGALLPFSSWFVQQRRPLLRPACCSRGSAAGADAAAVRRLVQSITALRYAASNQPVLSIPNLPVSPGAARAAAAGAPQRADGLQRARGRRPDAPAGGNHQGQQPPAQAGGERRAAAHHLRVCAAAADAHHGVGGGVPAWLPGQVAG